MTSFIRSSAAVLSVLTLGLLTGCGSEDSASTDTGSGVQSASLESVMSALPTQSQILEKQSYAYLMAAPNVSKPSIDTVAANSHKASDALKDKATGGDAASAKVNDKCAVYEQAAIGLISTPAAKWTIIGEANRNIIIGQSGVNQINGYASVLETASADDAGSLFNDFKSNVVACNEAMKALYPADADKFAMQSPSVDGGSGMVILHGTFNGKPFTVALSQKDKYLFSTWFTTTGTGGEDTISSATQIVQGLTLDNVSHL